MSDVEKLNKYTGPENGIDVNGAERRLEKVKDEIDRSAESTNHLAESRTENARKTAMETAISVESRGAAEKEKKASSVSVRGRGPISRKQLNKSYKQTLRQAQSEMSLNDKIFSKVIHNKFVEKTSEVVGGTVARPNALLAGSFCAFVLTLAVYVLSKNMGYVMSGFETIAFFCAGWLIGVLYDYFKLLITGTKY